MDKTKRFFFLNIPKKLFLFTFNISNFERRYILLVWIGKIYIFINNWFVWNIISYCKSKNVRPCSFNNFTEEKLLFEKYEIHSLTNSYFAAENTHSFAPYLDISLFVWFLCRVVVRILKKRLQMELYYK